MGIILKKRNNVRCPKFINGEHIKFMDSFYKTHLNTTMLECAEPLRNKFKLSVQESVLAVQYWSATFSDRKERIN